MSAKKFFSIVVVMLIVSPLLPVRAGDAPSNAPANAGAPYSKSPAYSEEAARAVMGRVFGVRGEGGDIKYHEVELTEHSPANASVRSALIPGWGQSFNGEKKKGAMLFVTATVAAFGAYHLNRKAADSLDTYNSRGVKDGSELDDYNKQHAQSVFLGSTALAIWLFSIFDAYRNAYAPLYSKNTSVQLVLNDEEEMLQWRRKF